MGGIVFCRRDGAVLRLVLYFDRDRDRDGALADLGLSPEGEVGDPPG